jgi:hypothetical protein
MKRSASFLAVSLIATVWLVGGRPGLLASGAALPIYFKAQTIGSATEWRFRPLVLDLDRDGHPDLVATARLVDNPLHIWFGDGKGNFTAFRPTWTDTGYAALATGDINRDGFADIVAASHFGNVQTLLSDGKGGFTEKILHRDDGYVAARLADLNGDGLLDLVLVGFKEAGIEIYLGDGTGSWSLPKALPQPRPGATMPGRDLIVGDLNHDGHLDLVAAFQRWGIYIYYGDGRGGFTGGPGAFRRPEHTPEGLALGDVNNDGHADLVVSGNFGSRDQMNGPDVYLGDGQAGWSASSAGLKVLKFTSAAIALGDLDRDGHLDIVVGGNITGDIRDGYGLFWFRGDGKGGWSPVQDSGFPTQGLSIPEGVSLTDVDGDGVPEIIALSGGTEGSITIWKWKESPPKSLTSK